MKRVKRSSRNKTAAILVLAAIMLLAMSIPVQSDDSTFGITSSNGDLEWEIENPTENEGVEFNGKEFYQISDSEVLEFDINDGELEISSEESLGDTADEFFRYLIEIDDDKYILEPDPDEKITKNGEGDIEVKIGYSPELEENDWYEVAAARYEDTITFTVNGD